MKFATFIGIDQTGASTKNGKSAKPLPVCVGHESKNGVWRVLTRKQNKPLTLPSLNPERIKELLASLGIPPELSQTALIVDCVLGLPRTIYRRESTTIGQMWELFNQASTFKLEEKEFGRDVAEKFFELLAPSKAAGFPRRVCEMWSNSNSVFRARPYQKNIQTGTFRFWKELGQVENPWLHIWPYPEMKLKKNPNKLPWMFEGYPSLIWQEYLGLIHRDPKKLKAAIRKLKVPTQMDTWTEVEKYPDLADACVLVWGAIFLQKRSELVIPSQQFLDEPAARSEGWIMGLKNPK